MQYNTAGCSLHNTHVCFKATHTSQTALLSKETIPETSATHIFVKAPTFSTVKNPLTVKIFIIPKKVSFVFHARDL